jgi:hypothetical protein
MGLGGEQPQAVVEFTQIFLILSLANKALNFKLRDASPDI